MVGRCWDLGERGHFRFDGLGSNTPTDSDPVKDHDNVVMILLRYSTFVSSVILETALDPA